ncbi:uncharacterized protein LOC119581002 isoform X2 [Penaeus monodon]|nr:uncharacterized protein LOC119581002 isoform X2 [Penaeus monodon]
MPKRPIHGTPTTPETSDRSKRCDKRSQAVAVEVTPSRPRPRKSRPAKLERKRTVDAALFEAQVAEIENAENMKPEPMQLDLETEVDNKPAEPKSVDAFVQVSRRMPHRSIKVQIAPKTFTQGTQTDIPCCLPCRCQRSDENLIADCLTDKADAMSECDSDEDDQEFNDINVDPDYESDSGDESTDDEINFSGVQNEKDEDPVSEKKYLVFHSCLMMLFATCAICSSETSQFIKRIGTFLSVTQCCTNKECGFVRKWDSQPKYGNLAAGNVLLSSAILFAGANPSKILHVLRLLGCQSIGRTTFSQQKEHLWPAVETVWTEQQDSLLTEIKERESSLVVGGDGRADTPGHSAKY